MFWCAWYEDECDNAREKCIKENKEETDDEFCDCEKCCCMLKKELR
jgi:hypothetical protein